MQKEIKNPGTKCAGKREREREKGEGRKTYETLMKR